VLVALTRGNAVHEEVVLPSLAAGVLTGVAAASAYQALAIGVMSILDPIVSLGTMVPVTVGLASGERPSSLQLAGIGVALGGIILAAREKSAGRHHRATSTASILLAVFAAVGFGFISVCYAGAAQSDPLWGVAFARATTFGIFALAFIVTRQRLQITGAAALPILAVGALAVGGNVLFCIASTSGYLSIVAVLSSPAPVVVVVLAYLFLSERLSRTQQMGVAAALAGVVLIAAG
jgi:drug/metabolite transporter (DMT)-like permease